MASFFGHAVISATLTKSILGQSSKWLLAAGIFSAVLPDLDVLTFYAGVPYEHPLGHRGFTHSILFALIWAMGWSVWRRQQPQIWFWVIFLSTLSHGFVDAMTNGGRGIGFFIPFDMERHFFSFRPIVVSPLHIEDFFGDWGIAVILSELKYIFLPCLLIAFIGKVLRHKKRKP